MKYLRLDFRTLTAIYCNFRTQCGHFTALSALSAAENVGLQSCLTSAMRISKELQF